MKGTCFPSLTRIQSSVHNKQQSQKTELSLSGTTQTSCMGSRQSLCNHFTDVLNHQRHNQLPDTQSSSTTALCIYARISLLAALMLVRVTVCLWGHRLLWWGNLQQGSHSSSRFSVMTLLAVGASGSAVVHVQRTLIVTGVVDTHTVTAHPHPLLKYSGQDIYKHGETPTHPHTLTNTRLLPRRDHFLHEVLVYNSCWNRSKKHSLYTLQIYTCR